MGHRYEISDDDWDRIKHLLPGQLGQHGGVAEDNRRFSNAVLWIDSSDFFSPSRYRAAVPCVRQCTIALSARPSPRYNSRAHRSSERFCGRGSLP